MIQRDGDIKIIDLGAVLVRGIEEGEQVDKDPNDHCGAVNYIAPESIKYNTATTSSDCSHRGDRLRDAITGELPYLKEKLREFKTPRHQWDYQPLTQKANGFARFDRFSFAEGVFRITQRAISDFGRFL